MNYKQLTQEQRYQIYILLKAEHTKTEISSILGVHKSTIGRELARNLGKRGYRPQQAHSLALQRRQIKNQRTIGDECWGRVKKLLKLEWSPEQISIWLRETCSIQISHEWIYQYILNNKSEGGSLYKYLRCQKKRRKRYGVYNSRGQLINRVSIEERPEIVDQRSRIGDWEVDTIIGKNHKQAIVTLTERKTKLSLMKRVKQKTATNVANAIIELLKPISEYVLTITSDNGKEFADHERISKSLKVDFYFAHPYASWERGLNENTNGLIRQYFPKGSDFRWLTQRQIDHVMERLNNRPRKTLGIKTPNQLFFGINPAVALAT